MTGDVRPPREPSAGAPDDDLRRAVELHRAGRLAEAAAAYESLLPRSPQDPRLLLGYGTLLLQTGRIDGGIGIIDRLLALVPEHPVAWSNRGNALRALNRPAEALASYGRAIAARPDYAGAYYNRGALLHELRRFDEAVRDYDRAIALSPDLVDAYWNKSLLKLLTGDYEEGWRLYEWRWKGQQAGEARSFTQPLWLGERPVRGSRLLLHAEAGLGDTIQFCRYAPMVAALGAEVVLELPAPLLALLSTLRGGFEFVRRGDPLPSFDMHCPLMSLPLALKTTLAGIPASVPYLFADPQKVADWRRRLGAATLPRVGIAWSGSSIYRNDRERSLPLASLQPLLDLPVELHALQKEIRQEERPALQRLSRLREHADRLGDFSDTAALVQLMDLVVSVDTSVAHLAGAMAKPLWVLLPRTPDHRWFLDRADSPWYPTATLLRQPQAGDWDSVVAELERRLATLAQGGPRPARTP